MKTQPNIRATTLVLLLASAPLTRATPFGANLISNGGAEDGAGSATGGLVSPIPGWTTSGNFTVLQYGAVDSTGAFPAAGDPGPANRGLNFFAGGPSNPASSGFQSFDVSDLAANIDSASVGFDLSGYLGGWDGQNDNAVLRLTFLNSLGAPVQIGPVLESDRGGQTGLLFKELSGDVPTGTRTLRLDLEMTRTDGAYNDGYADNLSLILSDRSPHGVPDAGSSALLLGVACTLAGCAKRKFGVAVQDLA